RLPALYVHHILPIERAQYHGIWNFAESLAADFKKRPHVDSGFSNWMRFDKGNQKLIRHQPGIDETRSCFSTWSKRNDLLLAFFHFDYGSYGYWDLPVWLWRELRRLKRDFPQLSLHLFCHEAPPRSPRRRREALLLPVSRKLFERILACTDLALFSNPAAAEQLRVQVGERFSIRWRPVFSNIGEPENLDFIERKDQTAWVIFGSRGNLPNYLDKLNSTYDLLPERIRPKLLHVIGGGGCEIVKKFVEKLRVRNFEIRHYEALDNSSCAEVFKNSSYLFLNYFETDKPEFPEMLLKSGVLAAANAYGVIPVICHEGLDRFRELTGHPGGIWLRNGEWLLPANLEALPRLISDWYRENSSVRGMTDDILESLLWK
ncbi:MAG: hypothetical protein J2P41_14130, partial [Blastocatellia bacterium]|nr:hypothetical protein [Blastocatellia bacterium]